jgi:hypothetical protein
MLLDVEELAQLWLEWLEGRLSAEAAIRDTLAAQLSIPIEADITRVVWLHLLDLTRSLYRLDNDDPWCPSAGRSQAYIEAAIATNLLALDDFVSVLVDDVGTRVDMIVALATLIDAEIRWICDNSGRPPETALFDGQRIRCSDTGLVMSVVDYWDPRLDSPSRVRQLLVRARRGGDTLYAHHDDLVDECCAGYMVDLAQLQNHRDPIVRRVAGEIRQTYLVARTKRLDLEATDIRIDPSVIGKVLRDHRALFLNQRTLGLGRDDAPIVVLGAEHAYDLESNAELVNLCMESIGSGILWSCGGRADVSRALSGNAVCMRRPFHIHPNDHYCEGVKHTWERLATAFGEPSAHEPGEVPGLGMRCYQIELSAHPSRQSAGSQPPSRKRVDFLRRVMDRMRETARILLIHGSRTSSAHESARFEAARAFLGVSCERQLRTPHFYSARGAPISVADAGGRRVIRTRALAGRGSTDAFLTRLGRLIAEVLSAG